LCAALAYGCGGSRALPGGGDVVVGGDDGGTSGGDDGGTSGGGPIGGGSCSRVTSDVVGVDGVCDLAAPVLLASGLPQLTQVVAGGDFVYYALDKSIMRVPRQGGTPAVFAGPSSADDPGYFAVAFDGASLYLSHEGDNNGNPASVMVVSPAGAAAQASIAFPKSDCAYAHSVVHTDIVDCDLYFHVAVHQVQACQGGLLPFTFWWLRDGIDATPQLSDTNSPDDQVLGIDHRYIYFAGNRKEPRRGGPVGTIGPQGYTSLVSDGATLFWTLQEKAGALDGAGVETLLYASPGPGWGAVGIAVDAAHLYVNDNNDNRNNPNNAPTGIVRMNKDGSDSTVVVPGPAGLLALDARYVYYTRQSATPGSYDLYAACK
jgi:hypothetical protein